MRSWCEIKNAWVSPPTFGDRYLTTTNNIDGAETRAQANNYQYPSQDWIIEHVDGGNVRLYDVWSGKYLTASSTGEQATVLVKNSDGVADAPAVDHGADHGQQRGAVPERGQRKVSDGGQLHVGSVLRADVFADAERAELGEPEVGGAVGPRPGDPRGCFAAWVAC